MTEWLHETFAAPGRLWWLAAPLLLWPALALAMRRGMRRRLAYAGPRQARPRPFAARALALVGLGLTVVALARPRWGEPVGTIRSQPIDVLVCLDVSRSMWARDARSPEGPTSRLDRAHRELVALAERIQGDRIGLIAFAGGARVLCPLTTDGRSFARMVPTATPWSVARGGTDLASALAEAASTLQRQGAGPAAVLLVTDGEDHGTAARDAARALGEQDIAVHCVALGTPEGALIPLPEDGGTLRDRSGQEVVSAQDPETLRPLADAAGGSLTVAEGAEASTLVDLYQRAIAPIRRQAIRDARIAQRPERFQWPLMAAFALWILAAAMVHRGSTS